MRRARLRIGSAHVIAGAALFVALGGAALALQNNSVRSKHIKDNAVAFKDLKGVKAWSKRVPVTGEDPDPGVAAAEAKTIKLAKRGTVTIYGKCYRNSSTGVVFATPFARTSADGAVLKTASGNDLDGSPSYLNKDTPPALRAISGGAGATFNVIAVMEPADAAFSLITAGHKLSLSGVAQAAVKQGTPPGNGPLGAGNRCSFSGHVIG